MAASTDYGISLTLPEWAVVENENLNLCYDSDEARVREVLRFAQRNTEEQTGGPFAAGVFEKDSGRPIVIGVNRVTPHQCSSAHAEIVTLSLAQHRLQSFDLGAADMPAHQLVVNWRPCAMCYGATIWSGVSSLLIAGQGPEMEEITGFDEGPLRDDWQDELERRGIDVTIGVLHDEALAGFRYFAQSGGPVYNGRQGSR
jgi:tRNA(Arg) A34 adenosine deaminase TadA